MRTKFASIVAAAAVVFSATSLHAETTFYGPTPSLRAADSPFDLSGLGSTFWLEDFEDGALNTPGVSHFEGRLPVPQPGVFTDSVDSDDGFIDGFGNDGHSATTGVYTCTDNRCWGATILYFDAQALGALPTAVGLALTDSSPGDTIQFGTVDVDGQPLSFITFPAPGNASHRGETAEDVFFGMVDKRGIGGVIISSAPFGGVEFDHLQYGRYVPEPSAGWLLGISLIAGRVAFMVRCEANP